jgi:hypothetical protein
VLIPYILRRRDRGSATESGAGTRGGGPPSEMSTWRRMRRPSDASVGGA